MIKKTTILLVMALAIAFLGFTLVAFGLPKDKQAAGSQAVQAPPPAQKPVATQQARVQPIPYDEDKADINYSVPQPSSYRNLGAQGIISSLVPAVPFVNVRVGVPETPGGNNHMRRQVKASSSGVVHMVYAVFDADTDEVVRNPADSNTNGLYFYNAYDCGNSNALRNGSKDVELSQVFGSIGDTRPRKMQLGGIFVPPGGNIPVAYGNRFIQRTDLGNGFFSRRGWATMKDGAECLGLFSMDTSQTSTAMIHPYMYPVNDTTWIATFRNGNNPNLVAFTATLNRGVTWSAPVNLATASPWFNSVEITGSGNDFYVVSMTDPADLATFEFSERPVYLKGTYDPLTGNVSFGTMTDIPATAGFSEAGYLGNMLDIAATMVGDTLHVAWDDWNDWLGQNVPGVGGHVHHAAVFPDGTIPAVEKIADINIDGRLPKISTTAFGFAIDPWSQIDLAYNPSTKILYCLWEQPTPATDVNGNPTLQWKDPEVTGTLANNDIFCSASPNNGRGWDEPFNITNTTNPGCDGSVANPCANEYWFSCDDRVSNDTIWVVSFVQAYPGVQESAVASGITPDVGPFTRTRDIFRLYKAPARAAVLTARGALAPPPGDTLNPVAMKLAPGAPTPFGANVRLSNIGLLGFFTDSIKIDAAFNDGFMVTTSDFTAGNFVPVGGGYNFHVNFNTVGVTPAAIGLRTGTVSVFVHSVSPASKQTIRQGYQVFVIPTLCLNRKVRIHSGSNSTDVGSQGSIKDQAGNGLHYNFNNSDRYYDGGTWIANSALTHPSGVPGVIRKVSRQIFSDKFLRCVADIVLDSVSGGSYYNLSATSVGTDVEDSSLVYKSIWEQSTHADSSDFLLQTVKVINVGSAPIDSVAMGVLYDIDVFSPASNPAENVNGDTSVTYNGRKFWLGWIAGNDVAIDTCTPNNEMYGIVGIPNGMGNPGDSIHPRGAVMYDQVGFSYNIGDDNPAGGDTLCQRYSWNLNVCVSNRRRAYDTLTGIWQDTSGLLPGHFFICGGPGAGATGAPYRNDEGYMSIAKKVYNLPVNSGGAVTVARYGLGGLAASVDSAFKGVGETYTYVHVASNTGLADLMTNAVKGIDWYSKHANYQAGPYQSVLLRGDFDNSGADNPADVVGALNFVFLNVGAFSTCVGDVDLNGAVAPSDAVLLLTRVFLGTGCPWCYTRCP